MSVVMFLRWDGVSLDQYDEARTRKIVRWEQEHPEGGRFHVAARDGTSLRVVDIWDSAEQFRQFVEQRLMPGVAQLDMPGEPVVEIYPVHGLFTPGYSIR